MKTVKKITVGFCILSILSLASCASSIQPKNAPCNNFGQYCEPKVPINQWRAN